MLESQKVLLRQSEIRQQINSLPADADPSQFEPLRSELAAKETEYRAALESEAKQVADTPERREWANLTDRFDLGELFTNVMEHRAASGGIAEVQSEMAWGRTLSRLSY